MTVGIWLGVLDLLWSSDVYPSPWEDSERMLICECNVSFLADFPEPDSFRAGLAALPEPDGFRAGLAAELPV